MQGRHSAVAPPPGARRVRRPLRPPRGSLSAHKDSTRTAHRALEPRRPPDARIKPYDQWGMGIGLIVVGSRVVLVKAPGPAAAGGSARSAHISTTDKLLSAVTQVRLTIDD
jgi:hypothetical protein